MMNLSMPLGEHFRDDMRSLHVEFHEFSIHRDADMNISLFDFFEFCILEEQELRRIDYMKDVVIDERIPIKFISCFSELYFILYEFLKFRNEQIHNKTHGVGTGKAGLHCEGMKQPRRREAAQGSSGN
jgi:hypothetical protein